MSFSDAVEAGYRNYFNFSGRAGRAEFWWFWLWDVILIAVFAGFLISGLILLRQHAAGATVVLLISLIFGIAVLGTIIAIFVFLVQPSRGGQRGYSRY